MPDTMLEGLNPVDIAVEAPYARNAAAAVALMEAPVSLERLPVHSIHSFHDHDRWLRGFVLVEAAEILTWRRGVCPYSSTVGHRSTPTQIERKARQI